MIYYSTIKSAKGNTATSSISEEAANHKVLQMDKKGNRNCRNCRDCNSCYDCNNCHNCNNCRNCNSCRNCRNCNDCDSCRDCNSCRDCYNCNDCNSCLNCYNCYDCNSCYNCRNCHYCYNCDNCNSCIGFNNSRGEAIIQILNLIWPISFNKTDMAIGCQFHSIEFWKSASDDVINNMHEIALNFWRRHKKAIFALIESHNQ